MVGIDQAKGAVVRIVSEGSYVDPAEGLVANAGSGSGFIISPDGLVVTNAHVVEGAGAVNAYVGGSDDALSARILGVSECNDLAVLDLPGEDYPYLEWFGGTATPGLEVYAAGFPLGDPEYTLVKGIVAKERADGDTPWASIDYSIQHDAEIQPGNSGGPLLTADGQVVGVNYAYSDPTNTSQYFAIPAGIAQPTVAVLQTGEDVESVGINGVALYDPESEAGGLWVSGVRAGSPASNAGLEPGDLLMQIAGRDVVTSRDGPTKAGYCDVLRTQGTDRAISVVVYRPTTEEVLRGELNNPARPLEPVPLAGDGETPDTTDPDTSDARYTTLTDSTGRLTTSVPSSWTEVVRQEIRTDVGKASYLSAAPDQANFLDGKYSGPGILYLMHTDLRRADLVSARDTYAELLDLPQLCTYLGSTDEITEYDDYAYVDVDYTNCGRGGTSSYVAAIWHPDAEAMVVIAAAYGNDRQMDQVNRAIVYTDVE